MRTCLVALLRIELDKAVKNRWFAASLAAALFIVLWSAESSVAVHGIGHQIMQDGNEWAGLTASSAYASWVVVGTGDPFRSGILFFLMPLFVVVPYSWTLRADMDDGSIPQQYVRCPRESVLVARYFAAFITSGLAVAIPLIVSFIGTSLFFACLYTRGRVKSLHWYATSRALGARVFYDSLAVCNLQYSACFCVVWSVGRSRAGGFHNHPQSHCIGCRIVFVDFRNPSYKSVGLLYSGLVWIYFQLNGPALSWRFGDFPSRGGSYRCCCVGYGSWGLYTVVLA